MSDRRPASSPGWAAGLLAAILLIVAPVVLALALVPGRGIVGAFDANGLADRFRDHGYDLDQVADGRAPVPRLYATRFPRGWQTLNPPARRKRLFIMTLLPLILKENEHIGKQRARALQLIRRRARSRAEARWLRDRTAEHGVGYGEWGRLLRRMDQVPPSLALAQGAIESGWGSSRFARLGNAVFGQWTKDHAGMTPLRRVPGATHKVGTFRNLGRSVAAYMRNLNTHPAYARLRALRADARSRGRGVLGAELVGALDQYSEIGGEYTALLLRLMGDGDLGRFDRARLESRE